MQNRSIRVNQTTFAFRIHRFSLARCLLVLGCIVSGAHPASFAGDFYVAPNGRQDALGTEDSPWDLPSALSGDQPVPPGSTIWLKAGVYRHVNRSSDACFNVGSLVGTADSPIQIRPVTGSRATLDGGLSVGRNVAQQLSPKHVWFRELEITVSENQRSSSQPGSSPGDIQAPFGGLNVFESDHCKFINLVVHDNVGNGIGLWATAKNTEVYGCVVYGNGWSAPDRGHGHGFYAQNREGWKVISNCIFSVPSDRGELLGQFYGSDRAALDNFRMEQNIGFVKHPRTSSILLGGGAVAHNNHAVNNYLYNSSIQLGYNRAGCTGGKAIGNVIYRGSLNLRFYDECSVSDNLVVRGVVSIAACGDLDVHDNQHFYPDGAPELPKVFLLQNQYDSARAHLAVFNWKMAERVTVDTSLYLKKGEAFRLVDPTDIYGKPVFEGRCEGDAIEIPMNAEFAAFILFKCK